MHLRHADGQGERQAPQEPAPDLVRAMSTEVTTNGDYEVTFHLKRPQPALLALLASGYSPIYPCHVPPAQMRTKPIGTGPFKFVEFKQNESHQARRATPTTGRRAGLISTASSSPSSPTARRRCSRFVAGRFDMTFPTEVTIPLLKDVKTPGAAGDLQGRVDQRQHQPDPQPRRAAVRQSAICAARWRSPSTARPSSTS